MPFTRDGLWRPPTETDVAEFRKKIKTEIEATPKEQPVNLPPDVMQSLVNTAKGGELASSQLDTFLTISKLQGPADLVVPVYGGLHVLKECVNSVAQRTRWPYHLYLVDDASPDPKVREYLKELDADENVTVLFNQKNRGFPATVNRGINAGSNPYVIVLNSDIIVTEGWLTKLLMALEADPKNQIVNPVTNNTALINVSMYPGTSYLDMDTALNRNRSLNYPEVMPTGFCLGLRRSNFDEVGPLDESFGVGYGEETNHWFKTVKAVDDDGTVKGYRAVLADNCYVFHERGSSFSALGEGAHLKNRRAGSERFHTLHPEFGEWSKGFDQEAAVGGLRTNIPKAAFRRKYKGNIAWLVKSAGPCGGMNFIADIVNKLIEDGYNAKVGVLVEPNQVNSQQVVSTLHCAPVMFSNPATFLKEFGEKMFTSGTVLSAVTELTQAAKSLQEQYPDINAFNHVQSWDVELAELVNRPEMVPNIKEAYKTLPNIVSSKWVAKEIEKIGGKVEFVALPGVNPDLFHVRDRGLGDERFTVGILLDKQYSYKGYEAGVAFCQKLHEKFKDLNRELRILVIGTDLVPECPYAVCKGGVSQSAMAQIMANEIDVFVDPATTHSYGLPALEALFSGAGAVTFGNKGDTEYSSYFNKSLCVNKDLDKCVNWVAKYKPERGTTKISSKFHRQTNVDNFIQSLYPKPKAVPRSRIEVVTPHLRKHGGPTTNIMMANQLQEAGHHVSMSMIYTDWNPEVFNMAMVPMRTKWKKVPSDAKVVIINSDNPFAKEIMELNPDKKYIMYKLSHNERFKPTENGNLDLPWDHIVTSTEWLRDVCINPKEEWTHKAWDAKKVTTVGWYHYGHPTFNNPPQNRTYGAAELGFRVGILLHEHPLKGSNVAVSVAGALKNKWEANAHIVGFGESKAKLPSYIQYFRALSRSNMGHIMGQLDVWFGASYTEGLGRMSLEAMSAGVPVVTTNTGAEFLKDGENCLLYEPGDAQRGGELVHSLVQNRDMMQKLAINGYKTAVDAADPTKFRRNLNKVIGEVLNAV